jgi:hypothetical protein
MHQKICNFIRRSLLHVSTLLGHVQGEHLLIHYGCVYIVKCECALKMAEQGRNM